MKIIIIKQPFLVLLHWNGNNFSDLIGLNVYYWSLENSFSDESSYFVCSKTLLKYGSGLFLDTF